MSDYHRTRANLTSQTAGVTFRFTTSITAVKRDQPYLLGSVAGMVRDGRHSRI